MNSDLRTMLKGISEILFAILLAIIHNYTGSMITIWCSLLIGFLGFLWNFPCRNSGRKRKRKKPAQRKTKPKNEPNRKRGACTGSPLIFC